MRSVYQLRQPSRVPNKRWFDGSLARKQTAKPRGTGDGILPPVAITPSGKDYYQQLDRVEAAFQDVFASCLDSGRYGPSAEADLGFLSARNSLRQHTSWMAEHLMPLLRQRGTKFTLHDEPVDDVQTVLLAGSLSDYLRFDDGNMSSRVERIGQALELLREHGPARDSSCV